MTELYPTHCPNITYQNQQLTIENVSAAELAKQRGAPLYVYSKQAILDAFHGYQRGLEGIPHIIAFAVKANGNLAILNTLAKEGSGADLTSGGELRLALKAGVPANKIVFSGVGKTDQEIREAIEAGILMLNMESEPELDTIQAIAADMGKIAPVAVRINPNIDAQTHPKISTGLKEHKFGVPAERAIALYERAARLPNIAVRGIAAHIGSSLPKTDPLLDALDRLMDFRGQLLSKGIEVTHLDLGGGLGIVYQNETQETPEEYARKIKAKIQSENVTLILEPGRSIVGNAGIVLTRATYVKRTDDRVFVIVDAGMNDLARPAIYGAFHRIIPVDASGSETEIVDVVGPICESSDVFGKQRELPKCERGDLLAICSAGAYGYAMASHYNGRVRPAEVLVDGVSHRLIRKRETYDDLMRNQIME